MSIPLSSVVRFTPAFWRRLGNQTVQCIKKHSRAGEGVDGQFPAYTPGYAKRKAEGMAAGKGEGAGRGRSGSRGDQSAKTGYLAQASRSTTPDMTLTGKFLLDLQLLTTTEDGVVIGWPTQGEKVAWNAESGRTVADDDSYARPCMEAVEAAVFAELVRRNEASSSVTVHNIRG